MLQIGEKYHLSVNDAEHPDSGPGDRESDNPDSLGGGISASGSTNTVSNSSQSHDAGKHDVPADLVTEKGRRLLEQQILARLGGIPREPIDSSRLLLIVVLLAVAIGTAIALNR